MALALLVTSAVVTTVGVVMTKGPEEAGAALFIFAFLFGVLAIFFASGNESS